LFSKKYFWTDPKTYAVMKRGSQGGTKQITWWEE